jgi:hypothetical protein
MIKPTVFFFVSPTARIGTTILARVVADYFILHQKPFHGFDTNINEAELAQRFPKFFTKIDLSHIKGQMELLDSILDQVDQVALVDVWSPVFPQLISLLIETQFIYEAEQRGLDVVFMLGINDINSASSAINKIRKVSSEAYIVGIINEGVVSLSHEPSELMDILFIDQTFEMGSLDHVTLRIISADQFSLSRFLITPPSGMSIVVRAQLKQWLLRLFTQLQSFELRRSLINNDFLR